MILGFGDHALIESKDSLFCFRDLFIFMNRYNFPLDSPPELTFSRIWKMIVRLSTLHWLNCILRCLPEAPTLTSKFLLPAVTFFWALIQLPLQFHASISHWFLSPGDQPLPACLHWFYHSHYPPFLHFLYFLKDAGNISMTIFIQLMVEFLEELRSNSLCCPLPMVMLLGLVCLSNIYF